MDNLSGFYNFLSIDSEIFVAIIHPDKNEKTPSRIIPFALQTIYFFSTFSDSCSGNPRENN